jgi:hypothetical protein
VKPLKIFIKDIEWTFQVLEDEEYKTLNGEDSHGITDKYKQSVFFKESSLTKQLVNHEVLHVYVASCCISSVDDVDDHAMEEICAEIIEYHLEQMNIITKKLYNSLKETITSHNITKESENVAK